MGMSSSITPDLALPDSPDIGVPPSSTEHAIRGEAGYGAVRTLQLLLIATVVAPLLAGAGAAYLSYQANFERAQAELADAVAVADENTLKVLDTHQLVAARIDDVLAGLTDAEAREQEKSLHERLAQQIKDSPQIAAAWAIDANGRQIVSARVFPVNAELDHSGRDDFQALQNSQLQTFIWALRARSIDQESYRPFFTVARRRQAPDGHFRGIVVVSVAGDYFASFYSSLLGGSAEYSAGVFRDNGINLARYPEDTTDPSPLRKDDLLVSAIAANPKSGIIVAGSAFAIEGRVVAYKRVGDYPVYVTISRTQTAILREWLETITGYVAIGASAAIGLMLLSLLALRRTRREQIALARARDAIAQRAAVQNQLHQAQKMEVVGQLTAGIAHDFNNLLTVISSNIGLVQLDLETREPKLLKFIDAAMNSCDRAATLVKRLLTFSRREPLDPQPLVVNDVITSMSDLLSRLIGDTIARDVRLTDDPWLVFVDPNQLETSLLNLALNARDAISGRGRLTITIANHSIDAAYAASHPELTPGPYVEISVSDTGCGMPEEIREKAFEPFFTTKGPESGTGLGLSQVYTFASGSGGHCTIESEPGHGTTVKLYLPRYGEESHADPAQS